MANKKITDLTLRSNFDATCNLPADDSSQTWRVTGAQIAAFLKTQPLVIAEVALTTGYVVSAGGVVIYDTVINDDLGFYNSSTGEFTIPIGEDGYYCLQAETAASTQTNLYVNKNGNDVRLLSSGSSTFVAGSSCTLKLVAGDIIRFQSQSGTTLPTSTPPFFSLHASVYKIGV